MSITAKTKEYIRSHASINRCLQQGVINYSALARLIIHDTGMVASEEAVLAAARRLKEKSGSQGKEKVHLLFKTSDIEIKNNIISFTLDKPAIPESLIEIEKRIRKENGLFFAIEGTKTVTVIIQSQYKKFMASYTGVVIKEDQVLISITTQGIAAVPGAVAFISGRFAEAGINIEEFMSCNDDTLIIIQKKDIQEAIRALSF